MSLCAIKVRFGKSLGMKLKFDTDNVVNCEILFMTRTNYCHTKMKRRILIWSTCHGIYQMPIIGKSIGFRMFKRINIPSSMFVHVRNMQPATTWPSQQPLVVVSLSSLNCHSIQLVAVTRVKAAQLTRGIISIRVQCLTIFRFFKSNGRLYCFTAAAN